MLTPSLMPEAQARQKFDPHADRYFPPSPFRVWRRRLGLTAEEAAVKLGISITTAKTLDMGKQRLKRLYVLSMVAIDRGLTIDDLGKPETSND
jgi:hypothetical protein